MRPLVQFSLSVLSNSLWPRGLKHARLPVHHQLHEHAQTHVHRVSDAIQPSHPLLSPSPSAFNLRHIRVFSNESALCLSIGALVSVLLMNILDWCEELTHCKRPWCWERHKSKERQLSYFYVISMLCFLRYSASSLTFQIFLA